ncbi:hypothetical protein [Streptomyces sp. NPDC059224]|uniref:hypothetical protein n=1 Tax=Streptomyces sp. NPDC059224 TaxID=3346775 RepID=UPI0036C80CE3
MGLLRRLFAGGQLPPTKDGYQPPPGALAEGWQCLDPDCGEGGYFPVPRTDIPRWCETCGEETYPRLAWPWEHGARRAELDALLAEAERDRDECLGLLVRLHLLAWSFEDHLMDGDTRAAQGVLAHTDRQLRGAMREQPHLTEGSYRFAMVLGALRSGGPEIALRVLEPWVELARQQGPGYGTDLEHDNAARTNYRNLVSSCLEWLGDGRTPGHPVYGTVVRWMLDTARAPHVRDWLTGDQDRALDALDPYWRGAP